MQTARQQLLTAPEISLHDPGAPDSFRVANSKQRAEIRRELQSAEHFVFTAVPSPEDIGDEIIMSIHAMLEADVWRLPFPVCSFEFDIDTVVSEDEAPQHPLHAPMLRAGGEFLSETGKQYSKSLGPHRFIALLKAQPTDQPIEIIPDEPNPPLIVPSFMHNLYLRARPGAWLEPIRTKNVPAGAVVCASLLVMLQTKGIKRERWGISGPVPIGRKEPSNAYTRVMIREAVEAGHGASVPGSRHRVRLHLRRGHTRQQPYGPRHMNLSRRVWIEPMLVGYAEEGTIEHAGYDVYREQPLAIAQPEES